MLQVFTPESIELWLGLTAKIRDPGTSLEGGGLRAEKTNLGVVPLINFLAEWRIAPLETITKTHLPQGMPHYEVVLSVAP